ncbi:Helix-turn-helix domain-containing protein [Actinacidiphila alni]|uniref:Helix-turn-helix domain-containing protein n=1 Tax=Actinacidiphila alni TaxID=380248 RepID=A0A1I2DM45_9ACTN|nr:helix-turn-helix transcriptional regulator [Actinacidiphila alni]SFE81556.1 Helix-turn-helix domain-containing protein [Actinacidiphila alni]
MGQWEPLADRIPVDTRRLATQLRRMKDRSGLTVPALAARTAQSAESWEKYLNGRSLPPLDAVETLAQASGADYDRIGALWKLAEKAATGTGDRGRGKPVPHPDPLDPLGAEEGLPPRHRRRALLLGMAAVLVVGAALTVLFAAGPSTGKAPLPGAGPTVPDRAGATLPPGTKGAAPRTSPGATAPARQGGASPRTPGPSVTAMLGGDSPSPTGPPATGPGGSVPPRTTAPADPGAPPSGTVSPTSSASPTTTPTQAPTPSPTRSGGLCLGLIVLNVCVGG